MNEVFYGYLLKGELYGIFYKENNSLKEIIKDLGLEETKELFKEIKWSSPAPDMEEREAEAMNYDYDEVLFIKLCEKRSVEEALNIKYKAMKALNSRSNDPVFDGALDEESEKELKEETKKTLDDLKNANALELFNQAYKLKGDYRNAEKYYVVDFDGNRVKEK